MIIDIDSLCRRWNSVQIKPDFDRIVLVIIQEKGRLYIAKSRYTPMGWDALEKDYYYHNITHWLNIKEE